MHHKLLINRKASNTDAREMMDRTLLSSLLLSLHFRKFCSDFIIKVENHFTSAVMISASVISQSFIHQKNGRNRNTTILNKEINYSSSPTLTILFTKQSTPLYRVDCPTCCIYIETYKSGDL